MKFQGQGLGLGALCLLAAFSASAHAEPQVITQQEIRQVLADPPTYAGHYEQRIPAGKGWRCDKELFYRIDWKATLGDTKIDFDNDANADIEVQIDNSQVKATGLRKGGLACTWMGGKGTVTLRSLNAKVKLILNSQDGKAHVDLRELAMKGIEFKDVKVVVGAYEVGGDAPEWLNGWIDDNLPKLIKKFMQSELKKRFNEWLAKKVNERIDGEGPLVDLPLP